MLVSEKYKLLFILAHKCGQYTISSYLKRLEESNNNIPTNYYTHEFTKDYSDKYQDYLKILIVRNPYERFVSGFLQDAIYNQNDNYSLIHLTFKEYCKYLLSIYQIENAYNYNMLITNSSQYVNKLDGHLRSQYSFIENDLNRLKPDKIIKINQINKLLKQLNSQYGVGVLIDIGNKKTYSADCNINIINTKVSDIAKGFSYPKCKFFYDKEIKNIVKTMYAEDFKLLRSFNIRSSI